MTQKMQSPTTPATTPLSCRQDPVELFQLDDSRDRKARIVRVLSLRATDSVPAQVPQKMLGRTMGVLDHKPEGWTSDGPTATIGNRLHVQPVRDATVPLPEPNQPDLAEKRLWFHDLLSGAEGWMTIVRVRSPLNS